MASVATLIVSALVIVQLDDTQRKTLQQGRKQRTALRALQVAMAQLVAIQASAVAVVQRVDTRCQTVQLALQQMTAERAMLVGTALGPAPPQCAAVLVPVADTQMQTRLQVPQQMVALLVQPASMSLRLAVIRIRTASSVSPVHTQSCQLVAHLQHALTVHLAGLLRPQVAAWRQTAFHVLLEDTPRRVGAILCLPA